MEDLIGRAKELLTTALVTHTDIVVKKASGVYVEDFDGRRYTDFTSGLATTNIGHNHPAVVEAIKKQAENFIHSGCIFYYESLVALAGRLREITPPGIEMFFFSNSSSRGFIPGGRGLWRLPAVFMEGPSEPSASPRRT
jgi:4-aminobutyrate aminotransferase